MMSHQFEKRGAFAALSADGTEYVIEKHVDVLISTELDGSTHRVDGFTFLRTTEGERATARAKGKYTIHTFAGDIEVTSNDPNAP